MSPQTVWIDAVCINQQDLDEPSNQVALMGDIYRLASSTFVHLGDSAIEYSVLDDTITSAQWPSLLHRPWFPRTWVVQELMLSRQVTIGIGTRATAWTDLLSLFEARKLEMPTLISLRFEFIHEYGIRPPMDHVPRDGNANLPDPQSAIAESSTDSKRPYPIASQDHETLKPSGNINLNYWRLPRILYHTRHFECEDERDELFAILPLFCRPTPQLLLPDYTKSVVNVFADFSWFFLEQDMSDALSYITPAPETPSWVTRWSSSTQVLSMAQQPGFREGYPQGLRAAKACKSFDGSKNVRLRGMIVGKLTARVTLRRYHVKVISKGIESAVHFTFEYDRSSWGSGYGSDQSSVIIRSGLSSSPSHKKNATTAYEAIYATLNGVRRALEQFQDAETLDWQVMSPAVWQRIESEAPHAKFTIADHKFDEMWTSVDKWLTNTTVYQSVRTTTREATLVVPATSTVMTLVGFGAKFPLLILGNSTRLRTQSHMIRSPSQFRQSLIILSTSIQTTNSIRHSDMIGMMEEAIIQSPRD